MTERQIIRILLFASLIFLMDKPEIELKAQEAEEEEDSKSFVSLESEIPEVLYQGMKEFIETNSKLDQYSLMSSALANFLFQNGCDDRAVIERYLQDIFNHSEN